MAYLPISLLLYLPIIIPKYVKDALHRAKTMLAKK